MDGGDRYEYHGEKTWGIHLVEISHGWKITCMYFRYP